MMASVVRRDKQTDMIMAGRASLLALHNIFNIKEIATFFHFIHVIM